ncbi:hypothetical protein LSAT2_023002 [Lamellibrachia satsuma]|nr:hypothetical protein LSAT2_023002 [Lamellibrachia satsuma]
MTVKPGRSNQELTAMLDTRCTRRLDQRHIVSLALTKRREFPGLQGNYSSCPDITHRAPSSIQLADTIRKCQEYTSRKTMPLKSGYEYLRERRFTAQWSFIFHSRFLAENAPPDFRVCRRRPTIRPSTFVRFRSFCEHSK